MENMEAVESVDKIKTRVVGVDIRIDKTTIAVVDIRGEIVAQDHFPTTDYPDVNDYVTALSENIFALLEENGGYESVRSIGVSAPSASSISGCIENAANLPWKGVIPLSAMLRDRLGLAVAVANDAHITALGEKTYGSAHGMKDFVVVTISLTDNPIWVMTVSLVRSDIPVWRSMVASAVVANMVAWRPTAPKKD